MNEIFNQNIALDYNGPINLDYPGYQDDWLDRPVFDRFKYQVELHPMRIAIRDYQGSINYADLYFQCVCLSQYIDSYVSPGEPIVLALPIDRYYPAAMLASLASGHPYIPIDLSYPPERLKHILEYSGAKYVLTDKENVDFLNNFIPQHMVVLLRESVEDSTICDDWHPSSTQEDISYIIYTSGSTGKPKGVFQNQRGLTHDIMQYTCSVHLRPDDVLSGIYSPSVNGALRDIYGALLNGAALLLIDLKRDGMSYAIKAIQQYNVTILHAMPPVMRSLLQSLPTSENKFNVRLVYMAGDKLFPSDIQLVRSCLNAEAMIYVGIGSTECATLYRQWFVPNDYIPKSALIPSGYSIQQRVVEVLNTEGFPVEVDEVGEIFVSSPYIALGYWRDENLTRVHFQKLLDRPGWVRFATGDLGRILEDGLLVFEGRADRQIKIRGYRVEPAEVEAAFREMVGVRDVSVISIQIEDKIRLVAFVMITEDTHKDLLGQKIRKILPAHLCPSDIIEIENIPILSNFKVDYNALIKIAENQLTAGNIISEEVDILKKSWCKALKISEVRPDLSFLEEGGDSLNFLELHVALEKALGKQIPFNIFRMDMPFSKLSLSLENFPNDSTLDIGSERPQMFIFPPALGINGDILNLRDEMSTDFDVILVDNPTSYKKNPYTTPIEDLSLILINQVLSQYQPDKKLVFLGWCCGCRIAHQIGIILYSQGIKVDLLIITDVSKSQNFLQILRLNPVIFLKQTLKTILSNHLSKDWLILSRKYFREASNKSALFIKLSQATEGILSRQHSKRWRAQTLHSKTLLLLSAEIMLDNPNVSRDLGWSTICSSLTILPMGLGHTDWAKKPNTSAIKAIVLDMIK
jgi:acyl-coenzyme A synthetase/AMP-(fatty) acid ligase/thioesterase domain-containing protein/acyl carrier protein